MAIQYWKDVGIQVTLNIVQRNQYFADTQTNNCEAGGWSFGRTYSVWNDPGEYLGTTLEKPIWPGWALWWTSPDDSNAVEPPEGHFVRELWDIWSKCEVERDVEKRNQLFQEFLAVWAREVPTIGFLNAPAAWVAKKQALRGLPTDAVLNWSTGYIAQYMVEQYWWEDPDKHA
jgi:ABC-type transport system substrate-binding protein